ncbi:MAG: SH3 domain-containing protein, partial [Kiritimatiellaeota bacterium]|nr:SH3 domain-containing protein [Kiritimatiellota bacterium]
SSLFIDDQGQVLKLANLRSGASVANSSYRLAEPGETLKVLSESNGWTKVAAPKNLTAWVSAKFIYLTPENAAKLANKPNAKKSRRFEKRLKARVENGRDGMFCHFLIRKEKS